MTGSLLDTNAISEYINPKPDAKVRAWLQTVDANTLFASVVTVGEIRLGIENLSAGKRRNQLESWLTGGLPEWFANNLLPVTGAIADRWGRITIEAKRRGRALAVPDGLIAATALEHGFTLVTRNVKDFAGLGASLLNPWIG